MFTVAWASLLSLDQTEEMEIPPFRLIPEPLTDDAAAVPPFRWASPEIGTRHRLGGEPAWVQAPEWPSCPSCEEPMTFYGQLDSISDTINLADCGMVYVFVCFGCFTTASLLQSG